MEPALRSVSATELDIKMLHSANASGPRWQSFGNIVNECSGVRVSPPTDQSSGGPAFSGISPSQRARQSVDTLEIRSDSGRSGSEDGWGSQAFRRPPWV